MGVGAIGVAETGCGGGGGGCGGGYPTGVTATTGAVRTLGAAGSTECPHATQKRVPSSLAAPQRPHRSVV